MDTKSKRRKTVISFAVFFLSVSLLLANGMQLAGTIYSYQAAGNGFSGIKDADYQNTGEFRRYIQGRLSDAMDMACGRAPGGYYYDGETYYSGSGLTDEKNQAAVKAYHESARENKNLLYRIKSSGKELYSNTDGLTLDISGNALPEGYNFLLLFNGKKVSVLKDGEELDIYGDGYYRGSSQWYVPGYKNFTADAGMEQVEIVLAAAKEPVLYSHVRYSEGSYTMTDNSLYSIAEDVRQKHAALWREFAGLAAGAVLAAVFLLLFRREKKEADARIGQCMGKIWFECKIILLLLLAAGLHGRIGRNINQDFIITNSGDGCFSTEEQQDQIRDLMIEETLDDGRLPDAEQSDASAAYSSKEQSVAWGTLAEAVKGESVYTGVLQELGIEEGAWTENQTGLYLWVNAVITDPVLLLVLFWAVYLAVLDICRNGNHVLDGFIRRFMEKAKLGGLRQSFSIQQMRSFRLAAYAGAVSAAVSLLFDILLSTGFTNRAETLLAQCLSLAVFLAVLYGCLSGMKQQAVDLDLLAEHIQAVQAGDYTEKESLPKDSSLKPLSDSLSQIRQGMETAVEEQLKSERMKVELVANVSHDLRTPLTSIISYIAFLKQEEELPEHVKDYIRILDEKAGRLHSIVQDVFAVSKAASGQLPVELKQLDFGKLLRQTLADMEEQIQAADITIKAEIPGEPVMITADGTRMYRVFQNLIQNAIQYSLEGSRVFVDLNVEGNCAAASVKNISRRELQTGVDFAERFVRADVSRTDGGAGLGLSIAKSFTEACGGEFRLETNADLFVVRVVFRCEDGGQAGV